MDKIEKCRILTGLLLFIGSIIACILFLVGFYISAVIVFVGIYILVRHINVVVTEKVYQELVDEWDEILSKNNLHF